MNNIAFLLTCHNRRDKTIACLHSLFDIVQDADVYLVDDGSTDGTSKCVAEYYPQIHIIHGDGNLFWSRGMYVAWKEAIKSKYKFYIWLNDDIELYPFFLDELMLCYKHLSRPCVISGIIEDKMTHKTIYGGSDSNGKLLHPNGKIQEIVHMNGNVVLVPQTVVEKIGIIDPKLHHDLGDVDYGLMVQEAGMKVFITRKPIAAGYINNYCRVRRWSTSLFKRFKYLYSPLGGNVLVNFYFRRKHFGILNATLYFIYLHCLNILPDNLVEYLFGNTYKDN